MPTALNRALPAGSTNYAPDGALSPHMNGSSVMRMLPRLSPVAGSLLLLALAAAPAAYGQMYKWVDERGVTNYSNEPPRGQKVTPVQDRVSTYSSVPAPGISASTGASAPDPMRARAQAAERQLELERQQRGLAAEDEAARRRRAYDECVRARGVDCDSLSELPAGIAPAEVIVPARRAGLAPMQPQQPRARTQPSLDVRR